MFRIFVVTSIIFGVSIAVKLINHKWFPLKSRKLKKYPLTSTPYYSFFHKACPLLGIISGCIASWDFKTNVQIYFGLLMGFSGATTFTYMILDPLVFLFEDLLYSSRHREKHLNEIKAMREYNLFTINRTREKAEDWLIKISYWIPRKFREGIIGDIIEDCREIRELGESACRIWAHVFWQLAIGLVLLWPAAIACVLKRKTKPPKG